MLRINIEKGSMVPKAEMHKNNVGEECSTYGCWCATHTSQRINSLPHPRFANVSRETFVDYKKVLDIFVPRACLDSSTSLRMTLTFHRDLDNGEPLFRVVLIPGTVHINAAEVTHNLVPVLFDVLEHLGVGLVEPIVGSKVLHAEGGFHGRHLLELDNVGVFKHFLHLFAVLDIHVLVFVFLVVFDGKAISRGGTFAT